MGLSAIKTRWRATAVAALLTLSAPLLSGCGGAASQPTVAPAPTNTAAKPVETTELQPAPLDGWVESYVKSIGGGDAGHEFHGELLVAQRDKTLVSRSFEGTKGQRFRIGSVTKTFTSIAILQLAEKKELSLDDSIRKHIPSLPEAFQPVTLALLLSHRAGLANYTATAEVLARKMEAVTQPEMLEYIAAAPMVFEPGTKWRYSNSGYYLLGLVIEKISGKSYADYLSTHIFGPAKMSNTDTSTANITTGLRLNGKSLEAAPVVHPNMPFSAGAISSTAEDLLRFARAVQKDVLLSKPWREQMWTDRGGPTETVGYGYGWMLRTREGRSVVGHNGGIDGFSSLLEMTRDGEWFSISLSNTEAAGAGKAGSAALKMALSNTSIPPLPRVTYAAFDPKLGADISGDYAIPEGAKKKLAELAGQAVVDSVHKATVTAKGGYFFKPAGQDPIELRMRSDGVLVHSGRQYHHDHPT